MKNSNVPNTSALMESDNTSKITRNIYYFSCQSVDGKIRIPEAKEIKKQIKETALMDTMARKILLETRDKLQYMVNNGDFHSHEIYFYEKELTKKANLTIAKEWKKYMEELGYEAHFFFEDTVYCLGFSIEEDSK